MGYLYKSMTYNDYKGWHANCVILVRNATVTNKGERDNENNKHPNVGTMV